MANTERETGGNCGINNIVGILARFKLCEIKMDDMSENNQFILRYYVSLMEIDNKLNLAVEERINEMSLSKENGKRTSLYSKDELENVKKHRKYRKHKKDGTFQPRLFSEEETIVKNSGIYNWESIFDPEKKLIELHKLFNNKASYGNNKNSLVNQDIKYNRNKLKQIIGLPNAKRGDRFYKYLVKRTVKFDDFKIFAQYNGVVSSKPTDLDKRIYQVRNFLSDVLTNNTGGDKYSEFRDFKRIYAEQWDINPTQ